MAKVGYGAIVASLEFRLVRITRLIPKTFPYAVATVSPGDVMPSFAPEDAVVMVEIAPELTHLTKAGRNEAMNNNAIGGMTQLGDPAGVSIAVWLSRNGSNADRIADAVVHEIGHAKSNLDDEMHDQNPGGILAKGGGTVGRTFTDSVARWMSKHLPKNVKINLKHFSGG